MLVEKSPPNIVRMRYLQALFPRASFVMILRHPVVVAREVDPADLPQVRERGADVGGGVGGHGLRVQAAAPARRNAAISSAP